MTIYDIYIPDAIKQYLNDQKITKITKAHRSGDKVYKIGQSYILKISTNIERLTKEKEINDYLKDKVIVSKTVEFIIYHDTAYYLKTQVLGTPLVSKKYLKDPHNLIRLLVRAIKIFHNIDISNCTYKNSYSTGGTFVHGDFCLPNIIVDNNQNLGFIDTSDAGVGDEWVDYAWAIWSLEYNLKTIKYTKEFLELLNINFDIDKYNKYIN